MLTTHELALAASINLENALMGFAPSENIALALGALNEIAEGRHATA
jgi:hypothetical protein